MTICITVDQWRDVYKRVASDKTLAAECEAIVTACKGSSGLVSVLFESPENVLRMGQVSGNDWIVTCANAVISTSDLIH